MSRSLRTLVALVTALVAAGCGVEGPTHTPLPIDGQLQFPDLGVPPSLDAQPAPDLSPPPPPSSCIDLAGQWEGTLGGQVIVLLPFALTGTISMTLAPAAKVGDYDIKSGQMVAVPKGVAGAEAKGAITGQVKCGVLDIANELDVYGVKCAGTVKCNFDMSGCKGIWTGQSTDGKASGSGTFELKRK